MSMSLVILDIHIDNGTKIFKEECVIRNPLKGFLHMSVGFAFDGNVTFFFNFKNRIEFILRNVFVPTCDDDYDEIVLDLIKNCYSSLCDYSGAAEPPVRCALCFWSSSSGIPEITEISSSVNLVFASKAY